MTDTTFITGANRGIGLELVKQYAQSGGKIFACCRNPVKATELQILANQYPQVEIHALDVCDFEQAKSLGEKLHNESIDIFINNAGILKKGRESLDELNLEEMEKTFKVNTFAPIEMVKIFRQHIEKSQRKQIVQLSSILGSISETTSNDYYSYRASKAAVNMLMKTASIELAPSEIKILIVHPGWVRTDMGGEDAVLDVQTSVSGLIKVINDHRHETGVFYRYDGEKIEW